MAHHLDTLLLLALPASGKSELRRYLASLEPDVAARDLGLGPTVQLDDYPYVHFMRRIDQEVRRLGAEPVFFAADDRPMLEGRDWATLIHLLNEDYAALGADPATPDAPAGWMLDRFDRARRSLGLAPPLDGLADEVVSSVCRALDDEAAEEAERRRRTLSAYRQGVSTVVIEFARGGPHGAEPPLPDPQGYRFSLRHLSSEILDRAAALYVWVTPAQSRRRNLERATPGRRGDASILHHGVPETVMRQDYGVDDFGWLLERGGGDAIEVETEDGTFRIPTAVFDNRTDHTSFLRAPAAGWDPRLVEALHARLVLVFGRLE